MNYQPDRVIYATTLNMSVSNTVGSQNNFYSIPTDIYGYPLGIFSYDGGNTWNDLSVAIGYINNNSTPIITVQPLVTGSEIQFSAYVNATFGNSETIPLIINIAILAPYNITTIDFNAIVTPKIISYQSTSGDRSLYSVYRNIVLDNQITAGTIENIPHNLGIVPDIFVSVDDNGFTSFANEWSSDHDTSNSNGVALDSENLYFASGSGKTFYYRVYEENS